MKAIIIDDEVKDVEMLRAALQQSCADVDVVGHALSVADGVKLINRHKPTIVFSDIDMPQLSGLQLLDFFNPEDIGFELIFVTNYSEYAVKAFQLSAIDYLLKPADNELLAKAVNKVRLHKNYKQLERNLVLKEIVEKNSFEKIALPLAEGLRFVAISDIAAMKADNVYTEVELRNGEQIVVSKPLKAFEKMLESQLGFFRCHRSYLINLSAVSNFIRGEGGSIVMENNRHIPIARDRKDAFTKAWESMRVR